MSHDQPVQRGRSAVRNLARAATAPVRNYVNGHFEMVKDEVRTASAQIDTSSLDDAWRRIAELESQLAEQSLHQTRVIAGLSDAVDDLGDRISDLERQLLKLIEAVVPAADE